MIGANTILGISPDQWTVIFTFLLVISTAGLWYVTAATLKHAKDASEISLRPYVFLKDMEHSYHFFADRQHEVGQRDFVVTWENVGATPARRMNIAINGNAFEGDIPDNFAYPDFADLKKGSRSNLGVRQITKSTLQIDNQIFKKGPFFIWGWVEYDDGFMARRRTEFCFKAIAEGDASGVVPISFNIYGPFNGSDQDCFSKVRTS